MLTVDFPKLALFEKASLLDAGCGLGRHICHAYRNYDIDVVGVDTSDENLTYTRACLSELEKTRNNPWRLEKADITALPFENERFDAIICTEVVEHIPDVSQALHELFRVLKKGGRIAVSAPRFLPERICWLLSSEYHSEPGGHIRIYKKNELKDMLEAIGLLHEDTCYKHALHSPYWWLKCLVGHKREDSTLVNLYKGFLEWDIIKKPYFTRILDKALNPFISKSIVIYAKKPL